MKKLKKNKQLPSLPLKKIRLLWLFTFAKKRYHFLGKKLKKNTQLSPPSPPKKNFFFRWPHHFQNAGEGPAGHKKFLMKLRGRVKKNYLIAIVLCLLAHCNDVLFHGLNKSFLHLNSNQFYYYTTYRMMIHFVTFYFQPQGSNVTIMMYGITGLNPNNKYAVLIFLCMYVHRTFEHKKPNVILWKSLYKRKEVFFYCMIFTKSFLHS